MEFRCPYCNYTAFRMVPGAVQAAECLSCGKIFTIPSVPLIESEPHGTTDSLRGASAEEFHGGDRQW